MKPSITLIRQSQSDLEIIFNNESIKLSDDEFIALLEDSIKLLQSQILLIEQSEHSLLV